MAKITDLHMELLQEVRQEVKDMSKKLTLMEWIPEKVHEHEKKHAYAEGIGNKIIGFSFGLGAVGGVIGNNFTKLVALLFGGH